MIPEEYVTQETVKLLRKAGMPVHLYLAPTDGYCPMISQAQAMRWLREVHKIAIVIEYTRYNGWEYELRIGYDTTNSRQVFSEGFDTYETAAEAGIQAACKMLKGGTK